MTTPRSNASPGANPVHRTAACRVGPDQRWPSPSRRVLSSKQLAGALWLHSQSLVSAAGSHTGWESAPAPQYLGPP